MILGRAVNLESLLQASMSRSALGDRELALRAVASTLEALGECLSPHDAEQLATSLPLDLAQAVGRARWHRAADAEEFFAVVSAKEGVRLGLAIEHAQAVCEALAEYLDPEVRIQLERHLPSELAVLFEARKVECDGPPPSPALGLEETLASGRPGSRRPISEAEVPGAQSGSVAASDNPHSDRKISSAREGASDEETLAGGRVGSASPISDVPGGRRGR
jgi:uncharacterized protein (DUF2267 family)